MSYLYVPFQGVEAERIERFIEAQASLRSNDSAPCPPPPPTNRKTKNEKQFADGTGGEGAGVEPNHATASKLGPLLIIQYFLGGRLM